MNVEGMTRENVASHLQKYRLYLKRMAGYPPAARLPLDTLQQVQQVLGALVLHSVQLRDTWCLRLGLLVDAKGLENLKECFTSWLAECMILSSRSAIVSCHVMSYAGHPAAGAPTPVPAEHRRSAHRHW